VSPIHEGPGSPSTNGLLVTSCIIGGDSGGNGIVLSSGQHANMIIANNIIGSYRGALVITNNAAITNNVFFSLFSLNGNGGIGQITDCFVANNIVFESNTGENSSKRSTFNNNLSFGGTPDRLALPPPGDGTNSGQDNIVDQDPKFVNIDLDLAGGGYHVSFDLHLQDDSPGKGAGTDGTDIGIYGGSSPFDPTVGLPVIQQLNTPSIVGRGADLRVTIKAKSN
jgi:hypothetical protein